MFDIEFGRGVNGFVVTRLAIVEGGCAMLVPLGGVGGLPVEGFTGVSIDADAFSRGFRNIAQLLQRWVYKWIVLS
jgi:hypothetical protein